MIFLFKNGIKNNDVSIIYDKDYLPSDVNFLSLKEMPIPPDDNKEYVLCLTPNASNYYWELKENEFEKKENLEKIKTQRIKESKQLLALFLETHPLYSNAHNNTFDYYNITEEKQSLLTSEFMSYQVLKRAGLNTTFNWNASGKPCEEWKEEEGIQLIQEIKSFVKPLVTYQQKKEMLINNAVTIEDVEKIIIDYKEACDIFNDVDYQNIGDSETIIIQGE